MKDNSYIGKRIEAIRAALPQGVTLIAVSKYHPAEAIEAAYAAGQRDFGESKAQDLVVKQQQLPKDINWHFIGHLQSNKIKYIAPFIHLIHSIDSLRLLQEVNKQGAKVGRRIPCLLQIHIAREETKFGFSPDECRDMLRQERWKDLQHIRICGVMGMATNTDNEADIDQEFQTLAALFQEIKEIHFTQDPYFTEVSMGMSNDYPIAVKNGSTLVRVGSRIFGERIY